MKLDFSDIPILDHHAHSLHKQQPGSPEAWLGFFTESHDPDFIHNHVANTLFYRYSIKTLAGLLGCEPTPLVILSERDRMGWQAWANLLIHQANITIMLMDYGFRGAESYDHQSLKEMLPCRVEPILRLETLAQELILKSDSFDQMRASFRSQVQAAKAEGYVALKSIIAYRTGLEIQTWSTGETQKAYENIKKLAIKEGRIRLASKPLNDTLILDALDIANKLNLPFQFHTGYGDSDVDLRKANPLLFRPLLESGNYRNLPLVILHMGYPYVRESAYLASIYPNVFTDLSLAIPFALSESQLLLTQLLGLAPTSKLLYASDGYSIPELFWLGARVGRKALESVLEKQISDDVLSKDEAYAAGEQILFQNAKRLYSL